MPPRRIAPPPLNKRKRDSSPKLAPRKSARNTNGLTAAALLLDPDDPFAGIDVSDVSSLPSTERAKSNRISVRKSVAPPLPPDAEWISASATRNFILKDPCLDWFKLYGDGNEKLGLLKQASELNFTGFIMQQGNEFEKGVVQLLTEKFKDKFRHLGGKYENARDPLKHQDTLSAMREGVPILYSAVIHHEPSRTFGIPDLIVRSDYLCKLVEVTNLTAIEVSTPAPLLSNAPYHYRIVDIKFTSLGLRADGIHLLNSGSIPAYKSQMWVYNRALAAAQGYDPETAYLLGRKWSYTSKNETYSGDSCFERLGTIDFSKIDREICSLTDQATGWLRDVKLNGSEWDVFKPHRPELYPNMCNSYDWPWHQAKKEIATAIGEISMLWNCGVKHREIAHSNNIKRWDDPLCTPELLGINGKYTAGILERILEVNSAACTDVILSADLHLPPADVELYVDFEGISSVLQGMDELPSIRDAGNSIFMIGVGYTDPETKEWIYRDFTGHDFSRGEESRVATEFCNYLATFEGKISLYHWSHYEYTQWNAIVDRNEELYSIWGNLKADWVDLLKHFKERPIVVKGALGFGLKEIVGAMYKHGLIKSSYESSTVSDGADAMLQARRADQEAREQGIGMHLTATMKGIIDYNNLDCRVLSDVLAAIRLIN